MSTEHDYSVGSPQYNWLAADLQKANSNRDSVPWIVFTGHRPMYSSDHSEWDSHRPGAPLQTLIEPLLLRNKVDVYACGHMHMYERVHPVNNGSVVQAGNVYHQPAAPVHVVQGNAGVFEDIEFVTPVPAWSARRAGKIGYGRMLVYNRTHLFYESLATVDGSRIGKLERRLSLLSARWSCCACSLAVIRARSVCAAPYILLLQIPFGSSSDQGVRGILRVAVAPLAAATVDHP